jgi:hypothetical protein
MDFPLHMSFFMNSSVNKFKSWLYVVWTGSCSADACVLHSFACRLAVLLPPANSIVAETY